MSDVADRRYAETWECHNSGPLWDISCRVCGFAYIKRYPDDRRMHRREHRKVLSVYEPRPAPEVFGCGPFLEVTPTSRKRVRNHLEGLARMFRRQCGFEFPPYIATENQYDSIPSRHFMLVSDGCPIGGTSARLRRCESEIDASGTAWFMAWMFVIPSARRQGHMARTWDMMRRIMPGILPEPPFTPASAAFFVDRPDVPDWIRTWAKHPRD